MRQARCFIWKMMSSISTDHLLCVSASWVGDEGSRSKRENGKEEREEKTRLAREAVTVTCRNIFTQEALQRTTVLAVLILENHRSCVTRRCAAGRKEVPTTFPLWGGWLYFLGLFARWQMEYRWDWPFYRVPVWSVWRWCPVEDAGIAGNAILEWLFTGVLLECCLLHFPSCSPLRHVHTYAQVRVNFPSCSPLKHVCTYAQVRVKPRVWAQEFSGAD